MSVRALFSATILVVATLLVPVAASASASDGASVSGERRACTTNLDGSCIKRRQVCDESQRGVVGRDRRGRKLVCRPAANGQLRWLKPARVKKVKTKQAATQPSGRCDSNYAGACVPVASDVDCAGGSGNGPAYVQGPVRVVGNDIYDLDRDGDGIACD